MVYKRFRVATGAIGLMCLCVGVVLLAATPSLYVSAQCGTQASSCLACHETQGQDPVNADGTGWHESHAFGDFCYICHAGNQQSMVKEEAHTGLVPPMEDAAASCQMCHASDLDARAAVYNTILASSTGGGTDTQSAAENDSADSFWGNEAAQPTAESADAFWGGGSEAAAPTTAPTTAPAAPAPTAAPAAVEEQEECPVPVNQLIVDDASMINYVQRYEQIVQGASPAASNNFVAGLVIGLAVVGGGSLVAFGTMRQRMNRMRLVKPDGEYPEDVVELLPALTNLDASSRKSLAGILANPGKARKAIDLIDTLTPDPGTPSDQPEEPTRE